MERDKQYNSKNVETKWYSLWESSGYFRPQSDGVAGTEDQRLAARDKKQGSQVSGLKSPVYVIVIPPPNVTGILHMGHALNNSIQDILVRWNRMKGADTLWVPGVDHAGIATQNVVEKKLAKEKKTRWDLGREAFLQEVWKWKEAHGSTITRQLRRLGASCDWSRERFTMDEGLSKAVREAFVTLYERGLIYRGNYIINWCPRCQTALSDEEAAHKDVQGGLYHIKYPIAGKSGPYEKMGEDHIVVATTRPETMLGDTAVAVNPEDPRYKHLIGKKIVLPLVEREIPVIADAFVDPEFGTGIVKVTPAHDPNDFAMGHRHGLVQVNVMTPDGKINENGGAYKGMDRFEARKKVLHDLEALGLFIKRDSHLHAVGHCYRCDTVVEPYLSKQWFVKMKPLAEKAIQAHEQGKTVFYPDRWTKVYLNWLHGIRDWCISRQIWWGHQIPAWYCKSCATRNAQSTRKDRESQRCALTVARETEAGIIVAREKPLKCPTCGSTELKQDTDVLDTWFSSWLWPFSTLGWPATEASAGTSENKSDLKKFYPTSDLVTAPEIIFFWVARMIMAGLEFCDEVPFRRIYIHGTVRAATGLKMSKSLGNSIDPLEVIDEMGADALRYSLVMLSAQDVYLAREKFEMGRNFTNKVWNACRFVLMQLEDFKEASADPAQFGKAALSLPNRWILSRLEEKTAEIERHLGQFGLAQAASELYHFVWDDFCDWYIELAKPMIQGQDGVLKRQTQQVLFFVCERVLRLLHPFMPFITEEIWQKFKEKVPLAEREHWPATVMFAAWPHGEKIFEDRDAQKAVGMLQRAVSGIRDLRSRFQIPPASKLRAVIACKDPEVLEVLRAFEREVKTLARLEMLECAREFRKEKTMVANAFPEFDIFIATEGVLDLAAEAQRIRKKLKETEQWVATLRKKLENPSFAEKAPHEILQKEKEKLEDAQKLCLSYQSQLASLG
ncbi:MAG: valine--tRNA ligase [Candidatus Omnitrophica bacterium]|nr:valine--tRNA ligase [Candidatus Omnitrophota bacterium]